MKLALMLGGMAAGRRAGGPGELLGRGTKLIEASPELSRLVGDVRGRLLEAGRGAVVAVATRQVEALTDRVGKRVENLAGAGVPRRAKAEEAENGRDESAQDENVQDEFDEAEGREDESREDESGRDENRRSAGSAAEQDEEPAEVPAAPPRRPRAAAAKPSAARTGRNAASATVKRTASSGGRAAARKPARAGRTQRSDGDG